MPGYLLTGDRSRTVRGTGIVITGAAEVEARLARIGLRAYDLDFKQIASEGQRLAAAFTPTRSGRLKESIKASRSRSKATITAGNRRGGPSGVKYAGAINYGWKEHGIKPVLFMQKADAVLRRKVPSELERQLKRIIRRQGM